MSITVLDILFFVAFYVLVLSVSLLKSRRRSGIGPGEEIENYFLAGRSLPWPLIGISIVAANISTEQFVGMSGQGAGRVGIAVSSWQLVGSVGIVIIAFTLLPRFLKAGIYTLPEYLEYRYNALARSLMALLTVVIYAGVLITAVLYSGGLTLQMTFGLPLSAGVWLIGVIAIGYTVLGGLKAVAWADLFQGMALLLGGILMFFFGLQAVGGWEKFATHNADRLHMILPLDDPDLPWTGMVSGMWIVIIYYCGLNQFIVQRSLAAKTLQDGQLGVVFAGALWLIVPFAIVMPGMMASQLYGDALGSLDQAYPILIRELMPVGIRGFMFAAITGAVISSLSSMLNSTSTIFTMDVYRRLVVKNAGDGHLIKVGRVTILVVMIASGLLAPSLANPAFGGVFQFIQQFQGYIWPGVVAAFLIGFISRRTPGAAGVVALVCGPVIYGLFQMSAGGLHNLHFLTQVFLSFLMVCGLMLSLRIFWPLAEPRRLPEREDFEMRSSNVARLMGALVILGVVVFFIIFW